MNEKKMDLRPQLDAMIAASYHLITNHQHGMSESDYRALWGDEVSVPESYQERFSHILLVDKTISLDSLWGFPYKFVRGSIRPGDCRQVAADPVLDNRPLSRYIAFVSLRDDGRRCSPSEFLDICPSDEVGLNVCEGLHLPTQFQTFLKTERLVVLTGSSFGKGHVPTIEFSNDVPCFEDVFFQRSGRGIFATRGMQVIPIS